MSTALQHTRRHTDTLIIGAGSAGCVLANRLSADPDHEVLVLEAGRPDHRLDFRIHMPAALTFPLANKFYNWWYESGPEPHLGLLSRRPRALPRRQCLQFGE